MKTVKTFSLVAQSIEEIDIVINGQQDFLLSCKEKKDSHTAQKTQQILDCCLEVKNGLIRTRKSVVVLNPYSHTESEPNKSGVHPSTGVHPADLGKVNDEENR